MAVFQTTRLQGYRWTSGTDDFTREQLDSSHQNFEERIGTFYSGGIALRPAAAAAYDRALYLATDENVPVGILYYCNGSAWYPINSFGTPGAVTPGASAAAGTSANVSRADHQHSLFPFATTAEPISTTASGGSASTFSRGDHVHSLASVSVTAGKIAAGAINSPSLFASGVVTTSAIVDSAVTRDKIVESERIPVGTIAPYTGLTAPTGWMMCEGGEVSDSSALGVLLGTRFGVGVTPGTVLVPDLRNSFARGGTNAGVWESPVSGGSATVQLSEENLPIHAHGFGTLTAVAVGDHTHNASTLTVADHNLSHSHSIAHSHTLNNSTVANGSFGPLNSSTKTGFGAVTAGTGGHNISTGGNQNARISEFGMFPNNVWGTGGPSTNSGAADVVHGHTVSGTVAGGGAHGHDLIGITGTAGSLSPSELSIVPSYVGVGFIIKL